MIYYKLILNDKRPTSSEVYPIVVVITCNKTNTSYNTGVRIKSNQWDSNSRTVKNDVPNCHELNLQINTFFLGLQKLILKLQDNNIFSFKNLREAFDSQSKPRQEVKIPTFNEFSSELIKNLKALNRNGNALVYQTAANRLIAFADNKDLKLVEIDYSFLDRFNQCLKLSGAKTNTISNYLRTIRAIYNKAIKAKLIDRSHYPFLDITFKSEKTSKRAALINDISRLNKLDILYNSQAFHSKNYFLFSLATIGMSFTDLAYLKPMNVKKGSLTYRRRKTHKEYNIKIHPLAQSILDIYARQNNRYLFPILPNTLVEDSLEAKKLIKQFIKTTNKYLARMSEDLNIERITTYVSRHTWATTAKRLGYSNEMIAEALGHEYGNKITNIYLDEFDQSVIDDLNIKVLQCLQT